MLETSDWRFKKSFLSIIDDKVYDKYRGDPKKIFSLTLKKLGKYNYLKDHQISRLESVVESLHKEELQYLEEVTLQYPDYFQDFYNLLEKGNQESIQEATEKMIDMGVDLYHILTHNIYTAVIAAVIIIYDPKLAFYAPDEVELALLSALLHDSNKNDLNSRNYAVWNPQTIDDIVSKFYKESGSITPKKVGRIVAATNYSQKGNLFYVDYSEKVGGVQIVWHGMKVGTMVLIAADWLSQSLFIEKKTRLEKLHQLFRFWEEVYGWDKYSEKPINLSVLDAALQSMLMFVEVVEKNEQLVDELKEELLFYVKKKKALKGLKRYFKRNKDQLSLREMSEMVLLELGRYEHLKKEKYATLDIEWTFQL
jgi:hypothetical protein